MKYTLRKKERLSSKKQISSLFSEGKYDFNFPFKIVYQIVSKQDNFQSPVLFSVSVPKKKIKKAVKRNLVKRRTREAYRLNKFIVFDKIPEDKQVRLMFIYIGDVPEKYKVIEKSVKKLLANIQVG